MGKEDLKTDHELHMGKDRTDLRLSLLDSETGGGSMCPERRAGATSWSPGG